MHRYYIIIAGLIFFCFIVIGISFSVVGSPITQRAIGFDTQRLQDFSTIQGDIQNFYSDKQYIPKTLAESYTYNSDTSLKDPETKKNYEYRPGLNGKYQLCTIFSLDSKEEKQNNSSNYSNIQSKHKKGYDCISYTVEQSPSERTVSPTPEPQPWHAYTPDESRLITELGLQQNLADYYASNGVYPTTLSVFVDKYDGKTPVDPATKQPYEYTIVNGSYQLCMTFDSVGHQCVGPSLDQSQKENNIDTWASHTALTFTIKFPISYAYDSRFASPANSDNPHTNVFIGNYRTIQTSDGGKLKNASIFQIQKIHSDITDIATYAKYNESGYLRTITINGVTAYKDSPGNTNPFYARDTSNGISYKVFMQDNNKSIYVITVFISDNDPDAAQIFAKMLDTLTFAPTQSNLIIPTNIWSNGLVDFTSSFEGKTLCLGQSYPIPFQILRAPKQVDINLYPPQANGSFPIEKNIPVTVKNDRVNQTYNWVVGQTADKLQILPGDNYKIGIDVTFGNIDFSNDFTSTFTIANCTPSINSTK